jgi:hypothetical protein
MRNKNPPGVGRTSQHFRNRRDYTGQRSSRFENRPLLAALNSVDDIFVEVTIGLKADLHRSSDCLTSSIFLASWSLL